MPTSPPAHRRPTTEPYPSPLSATPPAPPPPYRSSSTLSTLTAVEAAPPLSRLPPAVNMSHPMPPPNTAPPIVPTPTVHHPPPPHAPQAPHLAVPPQTPQMPPRPAPGPHTPSPPNPVMRGYTPAPAPVSPYPQQTHAPQPVPQTMPPTSSYGAPPPQAYYAAPQPGVAPPAPAPAPGTMPGLMPYSDQHAAAAHAVPSPQLPMMAPPSPGTTLVPAPGAPTKQKSKPSKASPLLLLAVGDFKDMRKDVQPVPEESVTAVEDGGKRLRRLKEKLNELQEVRSSYWTKQGAAAGAGAVGAMMTLGVAVAATGVTAFHNRNRLEQIKKSMRDVVQQINKLRSVFASEPTWHRYEKTVAINAVVFSKGLDRAELVGDL